MDVPKDARELTNVTAEHEAWASTYRAFAELAALRSYLRGEGYEKLAVDIELDTTPLITPPQSP